MTVREIQLPGSLPLSARRAKVGDRMLVTVSVATGPDNGCPARTVTTLATIDRVTRLDCGCDRAGFDRPQPREWPCPRVAMVPPSCYHNGPGEGVDYVEPYAGSLAVLLAKAPSRMETVNDLDGDLMTFWRVLREQPDELARVCALTPHARAEHQAAYDRPDGLPDLERARRVWVCLTQGRSGQLQRTGWRHYVAPAGSNTSMPGYLRGYVARFGPVVARLAQVSLENRAALDLIRRYGTSPDVLLYVDPPYLGSTRSSGGQVDMPGVPEHAELLAALVEARAAVVLSGYPSPLYEDALTGWDRIEFATGTGQAPGGTWGTRTEVIWCNRPIAEPTLFDEAAS